MGIRKAIAGFVLAGAAVFVVAAPAAAVHTVGSEGAVVASIGNSLDNVVESDTAASADWAADYPSQSRKPFGAGPLADYTVELAGSQGYAGPRVVETDYYRKGGSQPFGEFVDYYKGAQAGPLGEGMSGITVILTSSSYRQNTGYSLVA